MIKRSLLSLGFVLSTFSFAQGSQAEEEMALDANEKAANADAENVKVKLYPNPINEEKKDKFNLSYYEPMYILLGNPTTRVNFSFKYQGFRNFPFYLGYVQNIFWLLKEESKPFRDANFNPRIFYRLSFHTEDQEDYVDLIPYEHKSNGKSEPESRSFDASGAKVNWRFEYENWSLKPHFKALWRYNLDRTNKDFEEYVGPFEAGFVISQFSFDWLDKAELSYRTYTGGEWGQHLERMSHEIGLAFRFFGSDLTPAFYFQYFNGFSESLLHYNKREENFRIGFML